MRERADCSKIIKSKYPGLPKYECPNLEVLKIIAEYNFISRTEFDLLKERVVELEEEIKRIK